MPGEHRLEGLLAKHAVDGTAQGILGATLQDLAEFTGCEQHEDDVSLIVVKVKRS
jgi:serine phosphatase RsbU (regulator of sigma subunit)